jgi:DNA polymerase-3 subunit delta
MHASPDQLSAQLKRQLAPVYLVTGDEPLQLQECCDLVRREARAQGCTDREVIDAGGSGFDWQEILHSASNMSLFAERKLIELRLPGGKPGAEGSKALCEYLDIAGADDVLLIVAGKIDKQSTNSKWFKALDKAGVVVQVWPVDARNLPRWVRQRVSAAGMSIDDEALQLLCDRVEGNLLAASQEVEKLRLLASDSQITARAVLDSVADNARYSVFELADKALQGDAAGSLHMLHGLRGEGTEPAVVLWSLTREIRTLYEVHLECPRGQGVIQALNARRVWKNRIALMQAALARHDSQSMASLLEQATKVDGSIKGFADGRPWDNLEDLVLGICAR